MYVILSQQFHKYQQKQAMNVSLILIFVINNDLAWLIDWLCKYITLQTNKSL